MAFNIKKCMAMPFGHKNPWYYMPGKELQKTKEERAIRVLVTNNLKPSRQCTKVAKTAGAVLGQLNWHWTV